MQVKILQELAEIRQLLESHNVGQKEILTLSETAQLLGISRSYVYKLTCTRQIPFYRPSGKILYFQRKELMEWLLRNRHAASEEIAQRSLQ